MGDASPLDLAGLCIIVRDQMMKPLVVRPVWSVEQRLRQWQNGGSRAGRERV